MKLVIGITGASGSIYAHLLLKRLMGMRDQLEEVALVVSDTGAQVWKYELPDEPLDRFPFKRYKPDNFFSPIASGSAGWDAMIVIPCSVGTLGRIAHGLADDLLARAADVMLKERKKLVLVVREAPYNRIHLQNMLTVTDAGAMICPASPHFYHHPESMDEVCDTVVIRAMRLAGLPVSEVEFLG